MVGIKNIIKINTMDNMYVYCVTAFYTGIREPDFRSAHIAHIMANHVRLYHI